MSCSGGGECGARWRSTGPPAGRRPEAFNGWRHGGQGTLLGSPRAAQRPSLGHWSSAADDRDEVTASAGAATWWPPPPHGARTAGFRAPPIVQTTPAAADAVPGLSEGCRVGVPDGRGGALGEALPRGRRARVPERPHVALNPLRVALGVDGASSAACFRAIPAWSPPRGCVPCQSPGPPHRRGVCRSTAEEASATQRAPAAITARASRGRHVDARTPRPSPRLGRN